MFKILTFVVIFSHLTNEAFLWPNHNISTLKLLQIVHRHGDRTPMDYQFPSKDPFRNISAYWPEGLGELTREGRRRMYQLGQFIRREYGQFLGNGYSPREVYARSSISHRCLDSASLLLSGAYPPNNTIWQWNNGSEAQLGLLWQPFPIESFMPKDNDTLLNVDKFCPKAEEELRRIHNSEEVLKSFEVNKEFLDELSEKVGNDVNTFETVERLFQVLNIEKNRGLKWSDKNMWTQEYERNVFNKIEPLALLKWNVEYNHPLIERVRAGPLVEKLMDNFGSYTLGKPILNSLEEPFKMFVYSTHDQKLTVLMNALNIFNKQIVPFGATLLFELHQTTGAVNDQYFVKIYYFNETLSGLAPNLMTLKDCDNREECPFNKFVEMTQKVIPNDWDSECGIHSEKNSIFISNIVALVINLILLIVLTSIIVYNCFDNKRSSYIPLEGQ